MPFSLDWLWGAHDHEHALSAFHDQHASWSSGHDVNEVLNVPSLKAPSKAAAFLQGPDTVHVKELSQGADLSANDAWQGQPIGARHGSSFLFENGGSGSSLVEVIKATPAAALVPLHAASIVISLPGHIAFELGEGYLFGFQKGLELAFAGKALGALAAFGVGRSVGCCQNVRESLRERMQSWPAALNAAKSVERGGHASVFLVRIAPVPCVVKNYALSLLTDIPWTTFVPGTLLGLLPTTAAHVYAGTLAPTSADLVNGSGAAMKVVAAASTVGAVAFAGLLAAYCLQQVPEEDAEEDDACATMSPTIQDGQKEPRFPNSVALFRPQNEASRGQDGTRSEER
eukprot:Skav216348  [mRNA]  locus=scaffold2385:86134:108818:- [translate_table: standard]